MDDARFENLIRALGGALSRQRLSGVLGGSGLGAALGLMSQPAPVSAGCGKPCGPCKRCKHGRCKPKPNDTPCKGDGRCLKGRCNPRPLCIQGRPGVLERQSERLLQWRVRPGSVTELRAG
jgi:hypothetical protein